MPTNSSWWIWEANTTKKPFSKKISVTMRMQWSSNVEQWSNNVITARKWNNDPRPLAH